MPDADMVVNNIRQNIEMFKDELTSYNMTLESYMTQNGMTEEDFKKSVLESDVYPLMDEVMPLYAILDKEKIEIPKEAVEFVKQTGCAYHVCHISTKESVELIRQAKKDGVDITCETGPHYLVLSDKDLQENGRFKMNPPLRSRADMQALIEGIKDGTIDMIATDHAPHSAEEKSNRAGVMLDAPGNWMINTITLELCYANHPGVGYFDDVSFVEDGDASFYDYNSLGYLKNASNPNDRCWYFYDDNVYHDLYVAYKV